MRLNEDGLRAARGVQRDGVAGAPRSVGDHPTPPMRIVEAYFRAAGFVEETEEVPAVPAQGRRKAEPARTRVRYVSPWEDAC